jgi:hypothetical protein
MTANPIDVAIVDGVAVSKASVRGFEKERNRQRVANADEIRNTSFSGQFGGLYKADTKTDWDIYTDDTTTEDDGVNCIIDADGNRWKPVSGIPAPTTESLGGVFSHAAESHKFLTGIDADGTPLSEQPGAEDLSDGVTGTGAVVRANSPEIITPTGIVKADVGLGNVDNTSDATKNAAAATITNKAISAADNTITNLTTSEFATDVVDDDATLTANSDERIPTQKATKAYVDALLNANDAMRFEGVVDCSSNPDYPAADAGHVYRVSVAGKIGGASGVAVEAGDQLLCIADASAAGDQATVGSNWSITQANIDGAMIGPASAADSRIVLFDGTTGKLTKDSGKVVPTGTIVGTSDAQALTNKTLTSPDINGGTADALTSLGIRSTGAAFDLLMASAEAFTGNRALTWVLGDAARTITLGGNPTINGGTHSGTNTGDQTITLTGDVTGSGTGSFATSIGANKVTLGMMAQIATARFLGRTTASTGNVEDLTVAQATAMLDVVGGDSGSGGTKGLVPAPAAGDAAAGKYLDAAGGYSIPAGGGGSSGTAPYEHGRLSYVSATSIAFKPYKGDQLKINGALVSMPAAGIAGGANTGVFVNGTSGQNLAASTTYLVYAFINSGTVTMDFRTDGNGHLPSDTSGNVGVEVRVSSGTTKDDTRSLIGIVRTNGSSQFVDSATQRFVRSWFNSVPVSLGNNFTAARTTSSVQPTFVEVNTEIRCEFVVFASDLVAATVTAVVGNSTSEYSYVAIGWDGAADANRASAFLGSNGGTVSATQSKTFSEGYHYVTLMGAASGSSTVTYFASASRSTWIAVSIVSGQ